MGIAPIDLQTLFTQLDKVGKAQGAQREWQAIQQSIQGSQIQRKTEEQIQQVNEAQNTGEGAQKINDHSQRDQQGGKKGKGKQEEREDDKELPSVLHDPNLGRKIDISL